MRGPALLTLPTLALLLLLPAASAQASPPVFTMAVQAPSEAIEEGGSATVTLSVDRRCPNAAAVLEQQTVAVQFLTPYGALVSGPGDIVFEQQVCATQAIQQVQAPYGVTITEAGNQTVHPFTVRLHPGPLPAPYFGGGSTSQDFVLAVMEKGESAAAAGAEPVQEAPAPAFALVFAVLVAAALVLRRRKA